jgi:23S rRNA-intervening sequence protein
LWKAESLIRVSLGRARGSLVEAETELLIAKNLNYINAEQAERLLDKAADRQDNERSGRVDKTGSVN